MSDSFDFNWCPLCHHPRKHHLATGCGECNSDQILTDLPAPCAGMVKTCDPQNDDQSVHDWNDESLAVCKRCGALSPAWEE